MGKTYIGELLSQKKGMKFFDADILFDEEMKNLIRAGKFSMHMRDLFFTKLHLVAEHLLSQLEDGQDLVIAQAFTKEKNRVDFLNHFDNQVKYYLVHAPKNLAHTRMMDRLKKEIHVIDEGAFEYAWKEFESPKIFHDNIVNDATEQDAILRIFNKFSV